MSTNFAPQLEARLDDLVDQIQRQRALDTQDQPISDRPELREPIRDLLRASVQAEIKALGDNFAVPAECSEADAYHARFAAQIGDPVAGVLSKYRAIHRALWNCWDDLVKSNVADPITEGELLRSGSEFMFDYANRLCALAVAEYDQESDRLTRGWQRRRANVVHDLLSGREVDSPALEYELDGAHVAIIGWGDGASETIERLARSADRRLLLIALPELQSCWAWLGSIRTDRDLDKPLNGLDIPAHVGLAVGDQQLGVEGFRSSHQHAGYAYRVGLRTGRPITRYRDVALEVLAGRDEREASDFVEHELSALAGEGKRLSTLRQTLMAYFAAGHNAAATAARLNVHEQTVANRMVAIEQLTGADITARRAELETALRLRSYLA